MIDDDATEAAPAKPPRARSQSRQRPKAGETILYDASIRVLTTNDPARVRVIMVHPRRTNGVYVEASSSLNPLRMAITIVRMWRRYVRATRASEAESLPATTLRVPMPTVQIPLGGPLR